MTCKPPSFIELLREIRDAVVILPSVIRASKAPNERAILTPQQAAFQCQMGRDSGYRWLQFHGLIRRCPGEHLNRKTPHEFVIWGEVEAILRQQPNGKAAANNEAPVDMQQIVRRARARRASG